MKLRFAPRPAFLLLVAAFPLALLSLPASAQQCQQCKQECTQCKSGRYVCPIRCLRCRGFHSKKVCFPAHLERYGYSPTCWHPWPHTIEETYSQCPVQPTLPVLYPKPPPKVATLKEGPDMEEVLPPPKPDEPEKAPNGKPDSKIKKSVSQPFPNLPRFR